MISPALLSRPTRLALAVIVNAGILLGLHYSYPMPWLALLLSCGWLALLLWTMPMQLPVTSVATAPQTYWQNFAHHVHALLPLWAGHIALGKEQIDEATNKMTYRFDSILHQVDGNQSGHELPDGHTALEQAKGRLQNILDVLQKASSQRAQLGIQLHGVNDAGNKLKALATELARLQEQGPIAPEELTEFSNQLSQQSKQLSQLINQATASLHKVNSSEANATQTGLHQANEQESISAEQQEQQDSLSLQEAIHEILVHLQFQDRVSQILSGVENDMLRLEEVLRLALTSSEQTLPDPPDTEAWLAALKNSYTTHEQRVLHNHGDTDKEADQNNITFF
ncbi:hypothetical protein HZU77_010945 [Neisseriaceae bacterium TC5R-5]|nr:hypothetical protein [Neisseriaceae bacterium TC5R-5]